MQISGGILVCTAHPWFGTHARFLVEKLSLFSLYLIQANRLCRGRALSEGKCLLGYLVGTDFVIIKSELKHFLKACAYFKPNYEGLFKLGFRANIIVIRVEYKEKVNRRAFSEFRTL